MTSYIKINLATNYIKINLTMKYIKTNLFIIVYLPIKKVINYSKYIIKLFIIIKQYIYIYI